jgi:hypothetical protein
MNEMKKDIKAKWLKALRGGKYKQGKEQLKTATGRFCCLGVLCDLHAKATGSKWGVSDGEPVYGRGDDAPYYLPPAVQRWAGLKDKRGQLPDGLGWRDLGEVNDSGKRFTTIANLIEKHF